MYRIYFYKFLIDFWIIVPILVPFYKSNGMTAAQILTVQAAFSLSQLIFEMPSGYLSDVIGRKKTLILAAVFMLLGLCIYVLSSSFWFFIIAEVVLGLAGALRSGTDSAILYDHLKSINDEHLYMKCEGNAEFWSRTGTAVSSVAGGVLGAYSTLKLPFYVNLLSALLMIIVGISLKEPPRDEKPSGNPLKNICTVAYTTVTKKTLFSPMLQMGILFSTGVTAIWGYFLLYRHFEIPLFWHGIFFAVMQLTSAFAARHGSQFEQFAGKKVTATLLFLPGILFLIMGIAGNILIIFPFIMIHAVLWGISTPLLLERIQKQTASDFRATTLSVGSMMSRVVAISIGPLFGWVVDRWSPGIAFIGMSIFFYCANGTLFFLKSKQVTADIVEQIST
jgi:predicted MFS family arabinose efflux permease